MNRPSSIPLAAVLLGAGLHAASAVEVLFNFDSVPSGSLANTATSAGITFEPAVYAPALDNEGLVIPGSEAWRIDGSAAEVTVDNPFTLGRGSAPSPANALNALFQPVLVQFQAPERIRRFSVTLDYDVFGDRSQSVGFYDSADQLLGSLAIDQRQPGFSVNQVLDLNGVSKVVLPAGAFYDNLGISSIPEPKAWSMTLMGALAILWARRKAG